jgi:hypothetical protein
LSNIIATEVRGNAAAVASLQAVKKLLCVSLIRSLCDICVGDEVRSLTHTAAVALAVSVEAMVSKTVIVSLFLSVCAVFLMCF